MYALRDLDRMYGIFDADSDIDLFRQMQGAHALPVSRLELPGNLQSALWKEGIVCAGQLTQKTREDLVLIPQVGDQAIANIEHELQKQGLRLMPSFENVTELKTLTPSEVWKLPASLPIFSPRTRNVLARNAKEVPTLLALYQRRDRLEELKEVGGAIAEDIRHTLKAIEAAVPPPTGP
jgi:hypothetical protein